MKKIIILIIIFFLMFGTNNYQELNRLAIITNIGIKQENQKYKIIYQELIPKKEENKIKKTYKYYENSSNTLQDAFLKLNEDTTKYIYFDHLENIIIDYQSDQVIEELLNYFDKDIDNFNIIFTKNDIKKILKFSNNYKYVNSLIDDNISFREIKKEKLEKKKSKIPIVKIENNNLVFYKYIKLGDLHG